MSGLAHRPADPVVEQGVHDPVRGGEAEGGPAAEDDRIDPVDEVARVEQVGLTRAGATATHVDPGYRTALGCEHDGDTREPPGLVTGAVADAHTGDVDEGVRRAGGRDEGATAHCGSLRSNSMRRPGELKPSRS